MSTCLAPVSSVKVSLPVPLMAKGMGLLAGRVRVVELLSLVALMGQSGIWILIKKHDAKVTSRAQREHKQLLSTARTWISKVFLITGTVRVQLAPQAGQLALKGMMLSSLASRWIWEPRREHNPDSRESLHNANKREKRDNDQRLTFHDVLVQFKIVGDGDLIAEVDLAVVAAVGIRGFAVLVEGDFAVGARNGVDGTGDIDETLKLAKNKQMRKSITELANTDEKQKLT